MQPVGGGAPRPGRGVGFPGSRRQLDSAALLMLLVDADRPEPVRSGARELALFLTPEPGAEAAEVEETVEGLLLRLEEFCSLADMAFVKMVGHHVSFLEAHVLQAERDHGALSQALRKWLGSSGLPAFGNSSRLLSHLWFMTASQTLLVFDDLDSSEDYWLEAVDAGGPDLRAARVVQNRGLFSCGRRGGNAPSPQLPKASVSPAVLPSGTPGSEICVPRRLFVLFCFVLLLWMRFLNFPPCFTWAHRVWRSI
ncbi:breast carcinoma-amplified sequence 4 isoform X2 [Lagenorhynchus albirostris]|uniref:breast carcinoma-amplified sequence 4 isoform X2 n=1 Tax=Lagenorhynchus albirostris TaxID=27610 RepID=UPI0028EFF88C|nr:breast carcinoma-amplified sequence 4 isoform X2 [Lagenorhynchus albirostris]